MCKFIIKATLIVIGTYVMGYLLHFVIDKGLKSSAGFIEYNNEWNDIYDSKIQAQVLIQGSSRAWVQINPAVIDSTLQVNSYNLGLDGYNFHMQYCRYRVYTQHNKKPDLIIQSLDLLSLYKRANLFMFEQFIPYLDDTLINRATRGYSGLTMADYYLPLYKYSHKPNMALNGLTSFFSLAHPVSKKYKGFAAAGINWTSSFSLFKQKNPNGYRVTPDPETVKLFDNFLSDCKSKKIRVILVYTPEYTEAQKFTLNRDSLFNLYRSFAEKYECKFLDYSDNPICNDTLNFYNSQHLNKTGVEKFNKILAEDLKKIY